MDGREDTNSLKWIETMDSDEMQRLLEWGESYAEEEGISREDVAQAIAEVREEAS